MHGLLAVAYHMQVWWLQQELETEIRTRQVEAQTLPAAPGASAE